MNPFHVDEIVICIKTSCMAPIEIGKSYKILESGKNHVKVIPFSNGSAVPWNGMFSSKWIAATRFTATSNTPNSVYVPQAGHPFKVGDNVYCNDANTTFSGAKLSYGEKYEIAATRISGRDAQVQVKIAHNGPMNLNVVVSDKQRRPQWFRASRFDFTLKQKTKNTKNLNHVGPHGHEATYFATARKGCNHNLQPYLGLYESYKFCTLCDHKEL